MDSQYPGLRKCIKEIVQTSLKKISKNSIEHLVDLMNREKDPFTLNEFLQQWVNKIKYDRFSSAVETCFDDAKNPPGNWDGLKEEIYAGLRQWYRKTHSVSPLASAKDMSAIMEAYWHLSAKRFIDNCCMLVDKSILGKLPNAVQDEMFKFIKDDEKLQVGDFIRIHIFYK